MHSEVQVRNSSMAHFGNYHVHCFVTSFGAQLNGKSEIVFMEPEDLAKDLVKVGTCKKV